MLDIRHSAKDFFNFFLIFSFHGGTRGTMFAECRNLPSVFPIFAECRSLPECFSVELPSVRMFAECFLVRHSANREFARVSESLPSVFSLALAECQNLCRVFLV